LEEELEYENVRYIDNLRPDTLNGLRVLIVSCVHDYPKDWDRQSMRTDVRTFAGNGGSVILVNESIGWRRAFADTPWFPEIGRGTGTGDKYMDATTSGVGPAKIRYVTVRAAAVVHPVTKGVQEFDALFDMPAIAAGKAGTILMTRNDNNAAAAVAGTFGKGRVVLIAPAIGTGERNMEQPPEDDALMLLDNAVKWCFATEPRTGVPGKTDQRHDP